MMDYYFSASSCEALAALTTGVYENILGPAQGRAAVAESMDSEGNVLPAQEALGDPNLWYVEIRTETAPKPPATVSSCEKAEAEAVLGQWA